VASDFPSPAAPVHVPSRPRRTQEERSAETRTRILDATIECLVELGYGATTQRAVAQRSGVSRGAQLHHFPTRATLVAEAIPYLAGQLTDRLEQQTTDLPAAPAGRVEVALDLLWTNFSKGLFVVALELWLSSRTDAELARTLAEAEQRISRAITALGQELFGPQIASRPDFDQRLQYALAVMRGLATSRPLRPDEAGLARRWAFARAELVEFFTRS
jgi:AcrR family transcriptional regulator